MLQSFQYEAFDTAGRVLTGKLEANHEREAQRTLEGRGLTLVSLVAARQQTAKTGLFNIQRGLTAQDRILALKQLALLLKAGVPLIQGIGALKNQASHPVLTEAFGGIEKRLRSGETFTNALTAALPSMPAYVYQLAASGEAIGHLGQALDDGAAQMAYERQIRQDIRNALTYPAILITAGITAVLFIFIVVVPRFSTMVANAKEPLPWISAVVINTGMFLNNNKLLLLLVVSGAVWWVVSSVKNPKRMAQMREFMAGLPLVGIWLKEAEVARWASMLGTMLSNGVDLIKGLQLARDGIRLSGLRDRLDQAVKLVRGGQSLSSAIASQHAFSDTALSLIQVGEESGELPTMLKSLASLYEDTARQRMKQFLLILEPAAILLIGIVVGGIVAAIMLAITSINQVAL
ncbi:MAG: type II secretion system F family protein [Rhodospirillaceae bacterium]|nr:type II secretion system F family protein [Rhodospirillaceae bacterium]